MVSTDQSTLFPYLWCAWKKLQNGPSSDLFFFFFEQWFCILFRGIRIMAPYMHYFLNSHSWKEILMWKGWSFSFFVRHQTSDLKNFQIELSANVTDRYICVLFFLSAHTWLSLSMDHFQSSLGYDSQQDFPLDYIYHQPWIITGLSHSLAVITYFQCSYTSHNQICPSDDLLQCFLYTGPGPQSGAHAARCPLNWEVKSFWSEV